MADWVSEFLRLLLVLAGLSGLAALGLAIDRRFRPRRRLYDSPRLQGARRGFIATAIVVAASLLLLLVRHAGGPVWAGQAGAVLLIGSYAILLGFGAVVLYERFRHSKRPRAGRSGSRPAA